MQNKAKAYSGLFIRSYVGWASEHCASARAGLGLPPGLLLGMKQRNLGTDPASDTWQPAYKRRQRSQAAAVVAQVREASLDGGAFAQCHSDQRRGCAVDLQQLAP